MNQKTLDIQIEKEFHVSKRKVFRKLLRMKDFETFMPSVKESKPIESKNHTFLMKWLVDIEGIPVRWLERNTIDRQKLTLTFQALDGDLHLFEGKWQVSERGGRTVLSLSAHFNIGIPLLERLVGHVLQKKIARNFEDMLSCLNQRLKEDYYRDRLPKKQVSGYALIGHPYNYQHMLRYLSSLNPSMKIPSREFLGKLFEITPPHKSYDIAPICSVTGRKSAGHFIMCPIIPDMLALNLEAVFRKVIDAIRVAEDYGVGIVTLGGFTSIAGEQFKKEIHRLVSVPITTGNTLTAALAIQGVLKGCDRMGVDMAHARLAVIGGTGDIGSACAKFLSEHVGHITLIARNIENLRMAQGAVERSGKATVDISSDLHQPVEHADIIISAASAVHSLLDPGCFKSGAVICDIGYPKNISYKISGRDDILIFSGGLCMLPSDFDLGAEIDYGLPTKRVLYGCFAEAILLDLEERYESFSMGKGNITKDKVHEMIDMMKRHGFRLAPFFWGDRLLGDQEFATIREKVRR